MRSPAAGARRATGASSWSPRRNFVDLGEFVIPAVVSALVGAPVAWLVASRQQAWTTDALRRQGRDERLAAAEGVLMAFLDRVEDARRTGATRPISYPLDGMRAADWLALANVSDLFRDMVDEARMRRRSSIRRATSAGTGPS
jgi:hypothetical protein